MPHERETATVPREIIRLTARMVPGLKSRVPDQPLRVIALASYPAEAAATRYRILQFIGPLAEQGIAVDFRALLTGRQFHELYQRRRLARTAVTLLASMARRCRDLVVARDADVVLVQREAMLFGPPVFEYILAKLLRKPLVLDLDDATYVPYTSPTYGRLARFLKCFRKTDDLIRWSRVVVCGNCAIADHAADLGAATVVIPTVVDTDHFRPRESPALSDPLVLGWIGSHSTFRYLESIFPALQRLARSCRFRLLIVGSARDQVDLPGVEVVCRPWRMSREVADFQEIDIGLYPIIEEAWSAGKSGFKAIQYMSLGGSPRTWLARSAFASTLGQVGRTHWTASTPDEWHDALAKLLGDTFLRRRMGEAGRRHAMEYYTVPCQSDRLANALRMAAGREQLDRTQ